jgi:hypothetical protein
MQDANPVGVFSGGRARSSVSGPRSWKDERRGRYGLAASFVQAEGRGPKAGHRIRYRYLEPGTGYLSSKKRAYGVCDAACRI